MGEVEKRGWSLEEKESWCRRAYALATSMPPVDRQTAIRSLVNELARAALFDPAEEVSRLRARLLGLERRLRADRRVP